MTKSPAIAAPPGRAAARPAGAQPHRRVITQETGARPRGRTGPGRRLWAFGFMAGVQAALLSFVCVVVPAVAAFTATSAASVNDGLSWLDAARRGTDLWLLGHWGTMTVGSGAGAATVTLAPLGVALVSLLASRFLGRVSQASGWWLAGFGTLGFAVVTALVGFVVATPDGRTTAPAALVGAVVVAFLGNAWAAWPSSGWHGAQDLAARARKASDAGRPAWAAASRAVRVAGRTALGIGCGLAVVAAVGFALAAASGIVEYQDVTDSLAPDAVGGVVLALLGAAYVPNLLAWGLAYVSGAGFSAGAGSVFSPFAHHGVTVPAFPVLSFLPTWTLPRPVGWCVIALPVVIAALAGWWLRRRLARAGERRWWMIALTAFGAGLAAAAGLALVVAVASGAAGPGRMARFGAAGLAVGWRYAAELLGPLLIFSVVLRRETFHSCWTHLRPERPIQVRGRGKAAPEPVPPRTAGRPLAAAPAAPPVVSRTRDTVGAAAEEGAPAEDGGAAAPPKWRPVGRTGGDE